MLKKIAKGVAKNMEHIADKKEYSLASRYAESSHKNW